jgi:2',3'-cyclic-nucleotide 2'-phosphodiesterase (5'-nucleotidase family)
LIEQVRAKGPTLVVEAGNALFPGAATDDASLRAKAELILKILGDVKTGAMAVGARDLAAGLDFLKTTAKKAGVPLLSANLTLDGKRVLDPASVVTVGGARIGLIGVSPAGPLGKQPGLIGSPPVAAALSEVKKLAGKVDLIVVLAAVPYADALQLARNGGANIDLILQSHEGRGAGAAQRDGRSYLLATDERGRHVVRLDLDLSGSGPLVDLGERDRLKQRLEGLDRNLAVVKQRMQGVDGGVLQQYQRTLSDFERQRDQVAREQAAFKQQGARTLELSAVELGSGLPENPALKAQVEKLQPPTPH